MFLTIHISRQRDEVKDVMNFKLNYNKSCSKRKSCLKGKMISYWLYHKRYRNRGRSNKWRRFVLIKVINVLISRKYP